MLCELVTAIAMCRLCHNYHPMRIICINANKIHWCPHSYRKSKWQAHMLIVFIHNWCTDAALFQGFVEHLQYKLLFGRHCGIRTHWFQHCTSLIKLLLPMVQQYVVWNQYWLVVVVDNLSDLKCHSFYSKAWCYVALSHSLDQIQQDKQTNKPTNDFYIKSTNKICKNKNNTNWSARLLVLYVSLKPKPFGLSPVRKWMVMRFW